MTTPLFTFTGGCPAPFLPIADYPYKGGLQSSRYCQQSPFDANALCCLPCPVTNWIYKDNFSVVSEVTNWLSVGGFICCMFLLLSFACLPVSRTSRHYLTIGLVVGVAFINLGFIVSLWAKPSQCFDAITVNDMYTSLSCAFSGALVLFGGSAAVVWVFNRSLSLHLQICWQIIPGKKSFYTAQAVGWGVPLIITGVSLALSGVAYRFGNVCHINHVNSLATFWGPLLAFAGIATILQFATLIYVCRVYLRNLWDPNSNSGASSSAMRSNGPTFTSNSIRTHSVKATYRRVRRVLALQWRGIVVVIIVLVSSVYFAVVFQIFDQLGTSAIKDKSKTTPWVICIALHQGQKESCLDKVGTFSLNESIVSAVLVLLSVIGYWCLLFLGRISMFIGWWELMKRPFQSKDNFVSVDARRLSDPRNYEMLTSPPQSYQLTRNAAGSLVATAKPLQTSSIDTETLDKEKFEANSDDSPSDYFATDPPLPPPIKTYGRRNTSFSQPRVPSRSNSDARKVVFETNQSHERQQPRWSRQQQQSSEWPSQPQLYPLASSPPDHEDDCTSHTLSQPRQRENPLANLVRPSIVRTPSLTSYYSERSNSALSRNLPGSVQRITTNPGPYTHGPRSRTQEVVSPAPRRANSRTGTQPTIPEWDPFSTYAR